MKYMNRHERITIPYNTSIGRIYPIDATTAAYIKYIGVADDLQYDVVPGNTFAVAFITGKNDTEIALPVITLPLVVTNPVTRKLTVIVDCRAEVRNVKDTKPTSLFAIARYTSNIKFCILLALLVGEFASNRHGKLSSCFSNAAIGFSMYFTKLATDRLVSFIPADKLMLQMAVMYYALTLTYTDDDLSDISYADEIIASIRKVHMYNALSKNDIYTSIMKMPVNPVSVDDMVAGMSKVVPEEKARFINAEVIRTKVNNVWFGPGKDIIVSASMECMPLWIALQYASLTEQTFVKQQLPTVLNDAHRIVNKDDVFTKTIDNYLADKIMK